MQRITAAVAKVGLDTGLLLRGGLPGSYITTVALC